MMNKITRFHFKLKPEILLQPQVPKPLHGTAPRTVLGQAWWDAERLAAYQLTQNHCIACGILANRVSLRHHLEAHEQYDIDYKEGILHYIGAVPLCHYCHNFIHKGRLEVLLKEDFTSKKLYNNIISHGLSILKKHKLKYPPEPKTCASWDKWRLEINGKLYKGKFKSFEHWYSHYYENPTHKTI